MGLFGKSKIEKKIDRLNSIWSSAVDGLSSEIEKEAYLLLQDIIVEKPSNDAKMMLADCYTFGIGCSENLSAAKKLYHEISQDPNYTIAFRMLGDIAYDQKDGAAFECYREYLKFNPNDSEVYSHLADCYYKGLGTPKDIGKAMSIYKEVSTTDYAKTVDFQIKYGTRLDEQENAESLIWLLEAANTNNAWATYLVASILKEAKYLPFDTYSPEYRMEKALIFYKIAADLACEENDVKIANLAENAYNLFKAELNANAFAFYFKAEDGKEVVCRCRAKE